MVLPLSGPGVRVVDNVVDSGDFVEVVEPDWLVSVEEGEEVVDWESVGDLQPINPKVAITQHDNTRINEIFLHWNLF